MGHGGRLQAAWRAFRNPPQSRWVVVEQRILWRVLYYAASQRDAIAWVTRNVTLESGGPFVAIITLDMARGWNNDLIEGGAFWRSLARAVRIADQQRTEQALTRARRIGDTASLQIQKLSDPGDTVGS